MSTAVDWSNPYGNRDGEWRKGALHVHTSPASHCGRVELERMLDLYAEAGYDFVAISDHRVVTLAEHPGLTTIPAVEWNSERGEHTGILSSDPGVVEQAAAIREHDELLTWLAGQDAMVILNHPNWKFPPHYRREDLLTRRPYDAVEIYNHVIERLDGAALATDKWDHLLAEGRQVLGVATDDAHVVEDVGTGAVVVRAKDRSAPAILDALRAGNFYATSGVTITDIRRDGGTFSVESADAEEIRALTGGGRVVAAEAGPEMTFELSEDCGGYVRFTLFGKGSAMAWTQAFFL